MRIGDLVLYIEYYHGSPYVNTHMLGLVTGMPCLTSIRRAAKTWEVLWFDITGAKTREHLSNLYVLSEA